MFPNITTITIQISYLFLVSMYSYAYVICFSISILQIYHVKITKKPYVLTEGDLSSV